MACPPCERKNKCVCLYKLTLRYQQCSLVITKFHNILFHYFCIVILFKTLLEVYSFALYQDLVHPLLTVYFPCGGDSHMKQTGMLVVSLRDVNFGFWSRLGCSRQSANILSRQGLV